MKKYLHLQEPPFRKTQLQVNITLFDSYIRQRIKEDPQVQRMQLYQEIKQRGYNGARSTAYEHLRRYIKGAPRASGIPRLPDIFYVPSKISFLLLRRQEQLNPQEQKLVTNLGKRCPQINTAYRFAREFKQMMEAKKGYLLQGWINRVNASGIAELKSYVGGLLSDVKAIRNALTLPWSNGQVEGQINKLKTIKRLMYGRASFELLRKRLLLDSS